MEKTKILLVEDDLNLGFLLVDFLETNGFDVKLFRDGESGYKGYLNNKYDFCILDVMLPKMDGFTVAQKIRDENKQIPIIILTAKILKNDKLKGFAIGIDDYITKPFDEDELLCRINAILVRSNHDINIDCVFCIGNFVFDLHNHLLKSKNIEKRLTAKETKIISLLIEQKNRLVKRSDILKSVWGTDDYFTGRSLDVFITKIRKYLESDSSIKIENIPTVGYVLSDR